MKNITIRNRIFWTVGTVTALILCFVMCRYIFFELHGNKDWSVVLLIVGIIVSCIAAVFYRRKLIICTVIGYIGGFALGIILGVDGLDQGGGAINNWWIIWTMAFVSLIFAGGIWEIISRRIK